MEHIALLGGTRSAYEILVGESLRKRLLDARGQY
jgi:hypothetical protein